MSSFKTAFGENGTEVALIEWLCTPETSQLIFILLPRVFTPILWLGPYSEILSFSPYYSAGRRGITIIHYQLTDQGSSTKQGSFPCRQGPLSALAENE